MMTAVSVFRIFRGAEMSPKDWSSWFKRPLVPRMTIQP